MYLELLSKLYYQERRKLEEMSVFQQETALKMLALRKRIAEELESSLTIHQLKGRADITDEIKEKMLYDYEQGEKVEDYLSKKIKNESTQIDKEKNSSLSLINYRADEYAEYLFQSEKVYALERVLEEEKLFPESVYYDQGPASAIDRSGAE